MRAADRARMHELLDELVVEHLHDDDLRLLRAIEIVRMQLRVDQNAAERQLDVVERVAILLEAHRVTVDEEWDGPYTEEEWQTLLIEEEREQIREHARKVLAAIGDVSSG